MTHPSSDDQRMDAAVYETDPERTWSAFTQQLLEDARKWLEALNEVERDLAARGEVVEDEFRDYMLERHYGFLWLVPLVQEFKKYPAMRNVIPSMNHYLLSFGRSRGAYGVCDKFSIWIEPVAEGSFRILRSNAESKADGWLVLGEGTAFETARLASQIVLEEQRP